MSSTSCLGWSCLNPRNQVSQPSPSSHLSTYLYKVTGDTGDTWDTIQCVSVALGNGTLRGLTSWASRDAVGVGDLLSIVAVGGLKSWSTKDTCHWDTVQ